MSAVIEFIVDAGVTATVEYSWAKAVSEHHHYHSTTITVTNNIGQQPGTNTFVTFTPTYACRGVTVDCGTEAEGDFDYCRPALTPDGKRVEGGYPFDG